KNHIVASVEHKDAHEAQREIREINTGIMTVSAAQLKKWLPQLSNRNNQKEFYLTDIVALAVADKQPVVGITAGCPEEVQGINDRCELIKLERYYQQMAANKLALSGVTIADPSRLDIRGDDIEIAEDVTIDVNVILSGKIRIGKNTHIGP